MDFRKILTRLCQAFGILIINKNIMKQKCTENHSNKTTCWKCEPKEIIGWILEETAKNGLNNSAAVISPTEPKSVYKWSKVRIVPFDYQNKKKYEKESLLWSF